MLQTNVGKEEAKHIKDITLIRYGSNLSIYLSIYLSNTA